jgi:carotenoid cleavage dioxygenase
MMDELMEMAGASPFLAGNYAPVMREIDVAGLTVRGELPRELNGTLFRNGPNPHFPLPGAHWFTGDGMIHAVALHEGQASYRNRWVRTPKWLAENRAGRPLFNGFHGKLPDAPDWASDDSGVANTNILWHAGRLLALEEAHRPTEIDPRTLATNGYADFGALRGPFTAHPKIDPATGEMLFFGYNAAGPLTPEIHLGSIGPDGRVKRYERFEAPYASMVHDFMVTERYMMFPILPLTGSMERARSGRPPYAWEPDRGAFIGVMPRMGTVSDIRWYQGESCYAFHVMNAWEEGDRLVAEVMAFEEPPLFPHADGSEGDPRKQVAKLTRWTFDLAGGTSHFGRNVVDDLTGEFPRIDDRLSGLRNRHGWYAAANPLSDARGLDGIVHRDAGSGRREAFWLPAGDATSEPVFTPRGAEEGDGWVLAVVWRAAKGMSELLVFEALDIGRGPVATVELPQRVPFGFHGNFVPEAA